MLIELLIVDATDLHESWASGQSDSKVVLCKKLVSVRRHYLSRGASKNIHYREYKYKFPSFQGII